MTAAKAPQDHKPKRNGDAPPQRVSELDVAERGKLLERHAQLTEIATQLERALVENQHAQLKLEGRWEAWREQIEERYGMTRRDQVGDDGTISRS